MKARNILLPMLLGAALPCARATGNLSSQSSGVGLSWSDAVQCALKNMPKKESGDFGNPVLDALSLAEDLSSARGQLLLGPLIEELESSIRLGVRTPDDLAQLAEPDPDEAPGEPARRMRLVKVMKGASNRARVSVNDYAQGLQDQFRAGIPSKRLDFIHDSIETLLFFQGPYLSEKNKALLSEMREELLEAKRRRLTGLIRHAGDALAENGLPGRRLMPERLDVNRVIAYCADPHRPFYLPRRGYMLDRPPKAMNGAQFWALGLYQGAIKHAADAIKESGIVQVTGLGGELAEGDWDKVGIARPKDSLQASYAPLKLYMREVFAEGFLVSGRGASSIKDLLLRIKEDVYRKFGVFIELEQDSNQENKIPIEELRGQGLFRHMAVARLIQAMKERVRIFGEDFETSLQGLGLADGETVRHQALAALRGQRVLSVGAGIRPFAKILEQRYGAYAVAMDWWYALTKQEIGRSLALHDNRDAHKSMPVEIALRALPARFLAGLLPEPSFLGSPFEEVILHDIMEDLLYVNEPWAFEMLQDAIRITKPGGRVRFRAADNQLAHVRKELDSHYPGHRLEFPVSRAPRDRNRYQGVVVHKPDF